MTAAAVLNSAEAEVLDLLAKHRKRTGRERSDAGTLLGLARDPAVMAHWPAVQAEARRMRKPPPLVGLATPAKLLAVQAWVMAEAAVLEGSRALVEGLGGRWTHQRDSRGTDPGWPDVAALMPRTGVVWFWEVKDAIRVVTVEQKLTIATMRACNLRAGILRPLGLLDGSLRRALTGET